MSSTTLTPQEVTEHLQVNVGQVYRWIRDGDLPAVRRALAEVQERLLREATQEAVGAMTLALNVLQDIASDTGAPGGT